MHPDASLAFVGEPIITESQTLRRRGWLDRAKEIARTPVGALFYVSGLFFQVPTEEGVCLVQNMSVGAAVALEEQGRIVHFQELIGNRFFLFSGDLDTGNFLKVAPDAERMRMLFEGRGLSYNPSTLELTGYGEYLDFCVKSWVGLLGDRLGLPKNHRTFLPALSLKFVDDVNIFGGLNNLAEKPTPLSPQDTLLARLE